MHVKITTVDATPETAKIIVIMDDGQEIDITHMGLRLIDIRLMPNEPNQAYITLNATRVELDVKAKLGQVWAEVYEGKDAEEIPD